MPRILVLGGTTDASRLARALAEAGADAVFSYAGRTEAPVAQPLPMRVGGFGGIEGLAAYLHAEGIAQVIDAMVPLANMFGYVNSLRSMSQGRAQYTMTFDHYEQVPQAVATEVQAKYA